MLGAGSSLRVHPTLVDSTAAQRQDFSDSTEKVGPRMQAKRWVWLSLLLVVPWVTAACGDGGEPSQTPTPTQTPSPTASPTRTAMPTAPPPLTPACTPSAYTIEAGDTLSALAQRFNVTLDELMQENDIDDPDLILVGQELTIPCPETPATPAP